MQQMFNFIKLESVRSKHNKWYEIMRGICLGLVGIEFTFSVVAFMVLYSGFVIKIVLVMHLSCG